MKVLCVRQETRPSITWQVDAVLYDQQHCGSRSWTDKIIPTCSVTTRSANLGTLDCTQGRKDAIRHTMREDNRSHKVDEGRSGGSIVWSSWTLAEMRSGCTGLAWTSMIQTFVRIVVFCSQDTAVDSVIGSEHREQFALLI